jgi:hypothetical protein
MDKREIEIVTIDERGDECVLKLPARWAICSACEGCGTDRGASVECDGGGFTASEWAEQDEDFREDYLAGRYDQPCAECRGHAGRVLVVDRDRVGATELAIYDRHEQDEADYRALCAAERRMGA